MYQIFELEDSALPQQGILPISATKTTTKANHRFLGKDFFPLCSCSFCTLRQILEILGKFSLARDLKGPLNDLSTLMYTFATFEGLPELL